MSFHSQQLRVAGRSWRPCPRQFLSGALPKQQRATPREQQLVVAAAADAAEAAAAAGDAPQPQQQPQGVSVKLRKPVGIVFAQNRNGPVFVEEIAPGSNAEKCGEVQVGDVLDQCSAIVLKAGKEGQYEKEGYGQRPYDNWETVMIDCNGREFKTVMNALKSNNERWGINHVTLVFRKPTAEEAALCVQAQA
uniref:PDZ domain-containing protein n=1 Tax=Tetradesmus obliquus TaxID=3088 RepID=A0A383W2S3_TETOB|eukprot:jgi/Sobl393_1/8769/SZX71463.1